LKYPSTISLIQYRSALSVVGLVINLLSFVVSLEYIGSQSTLRLYDSPFSNDFRIWLLVKINEVVNSTSLDCLINSLVLTMSHVLLFFKCFICSLLMA